MINATQFYVIDPEQIEVLERVQSTGTHPYALRIGTKTGRTFSVSYSTEDQREGEIRRIVAGIEREKRNNMLTTEDIRWAAAVEIDKLRPYLRRIEKILKETKKETEE